MRVTWSIHPYLLLHPCSPEGADSSGFRIVPPRLKPPLKPTMGQPKSLQAQGSTSLRHLACSSTRACPTYLTFISHICPNSPDIKLPEIDIQSATLAIGIAMVLQGIFIEVAKDEADSLIGEALMETERRGCFLKVPRWTTSINHLWSFGNESIRARHRRP